MRGEAPARPYATYKQGTPTVEDQTKKPAPLWGTGSEECTIPSYRHAGSRIGHESQDCCPGDLW
jgi:hypothetical protein